VAGVLNPSQKIIIMNSIDKNQSEKNYEDVSAGKAGEQIKKMAEAAKSCFFCTEIRTGDSFGVRPMSIQKADDDGTLWFLSAKDSHKNREISMNPEVRLYFQGSPHSDFLFLTGVAEISDDREKIRELWEPIAKAWFTEGENDPRISVIKVSPRSGFYWDNKHGNLVAGTKMMIGALLGKTMDDSIQGKIKM
jgi:general stress protein 26